MPRKPKRPCRYEGCGAFSDEVYCEKHKKQVNQEYNKHQRNPDVNKQYGRSWKRIRDKYVKEHPLCECCLEEGVIVLMEEVHHKVPVGQGGKHTPSNLISLCRSCHNKIHKRIGDR